MHQQVYRMALPAPSPARELEHAERALIAAQAAWLQAPYHVTGDPALLDAYLAANRHYLAARQAAWGW